MLRIALVVAAAALAACTAVAPPAAELAKNTRLSEAGSNEPATSGPVAVTPSSSVETRVMPPLRQNKASAYQEELWQWQKSSYKQWAEDTLLAEGVALIFSEPADIVDYCPAWTHLDGYQRLGFWSDLLAAMAVHESGHNPQAQHVERFNDRFGKPVVSRGLLQISQESANGYGCGIQQAEQLHNPAENIRCAVRILSRWVAKDGVISDYVGNGVRKNARPWRGGARYWSVLRRNSKTADIQQNLRHSARCRLPGQYPATIAEF